MDLRLVSAGDDIKLWNSHDLILTRQFNPHDQNVSAVCWATDNSFLASLSLHSEEVAITSLKNLEISTLQCGSGCMCVDINETSRYMLTGGSNGIIAVWDLKARKVRKHFKDHKGPVTSAKFNQGSTSIASGSETGEIILYNVVTGQGCKPLKAPNVQSIQQVQYSYYKKHVLGSVSDDGCMNLWDCNTRQMINSTPCHRAPATSLSFSPVNDIFLISVGLDKCIVCHDIKENKVIKTMMTDSPLTSVDSLGDGFTVVVGTTRGKIFQYDLRMGSIPVRATEAHKSSVQCLRYQKEVDSISSRSSTGSKQSRHRQLPISPSKPNAASTTGTGSDVTDSVAPPHVESRRAVTNITTDVFSPHRDGFQEQSSIDVSGSQHASHTSLSLRETSSGAGGNYSGGVFSPMNANADNSNVSSNAGLSGLVTSDYSQDNSWTHLGVPLMDYNRINTQNASSGPMDQASRSLSSSHGNQFGALIQGENVSVDIPQTNQSSQKNHVTFNTSPNKNVSNTKLSPRQLPGTHQKQVAFATEDNDPYAFLTKESPSSSASNSPASRLHGATNQQEVGMSASPSIPSMHLGDSPGSVSGGASHQHPTTPEGVNAESLIPHDMDRHSARNTEYQRTIHTDGAPPSRGGTGYKDGFIDADIVRTIVREELKDIKRDLKDEILEMSDQLHKDIVQMHAEMVIKFQQHQEEMIRKMQFFSLNEDLLLEVERLKQENSRLKKNF